MIARKHIVPARNHVLRLLPSVMYLRLFADKAFRYTHSTVYP